MSHYVIDANVSVKWFVPEVLTPQALRLLDGDHHLMAPDLVYSEAGNAVWQKVRREQLTAAQARRVLGGIVGAPLEVHPTRELVTLGLELALESGCTVYDGCYLGLAISRGCQLVSADERLEALLPARCQRHFLPLASVLA